ncbi:MAG: hypothetical protein HRT61_21145, partial [Ekhidna sp.]|nr:hypothetical protein [Ekhidna sp.]
STSSANRVTSATIATVTFSANNDSIFNIPGGLYTVKLIDDATNCFSTEQVNILDTQPSLAITLGQTDQTNCTPNGVARVTGVTTSFSSGTPDSANAAFTPSFPDSYDFQWYEGSNTSGTVLGTDSEEQNLVAGFYTVVVTLKGTTCQSSAKTIQVVDGVSANAPSFDFDVTNIPSACDGNDGAITVTITGGDTYTYEWYEGSGDFTSGSDPSELSNGSSLENDATTSLTISNGATTSSIDGLITGLYTIVAVADGTGCRYQESFDLPFNGIQTTTTITIEDVDECPDNGQARVALSDNFQISGTLTGSFDLLDTISNGGGALAVVNDTTSQDSGSIQVSLISGTFTNGETINNSSATGQLATVTVTGFNSRTGVDAIENYAIYLYSGNGVPADRNNAYTITNSSGEVLVFPYIYDPVSGILFNGDTTNNGGAGELIGAINGGQEATFNNLPAGPYTAIARETSGSECWTLSAIDTVAQKAFFPVLDSASVVNNSVCDPGFTGNSNGRIYARAKLDPDDSTTTGIHFMWFAGADVSGGIFDQDTVTTAPFEAFYGDNNSVPRDSLLAAGDYTLVIETISSITGHNTCYSDTITFTVQDDFEVHSLFAADIDTVFDCSPTNQGRIEIRNSDVSSGNIADYQFEFGTLNPATADQTYGGGNIFANLEPGDYYAFARHNNTGCITDTLTVNIPQIITLPSIATSIVAIDSACVVNAGTDEGAGQIRFVIENTTANAGDYYFKWFAGTDTTTTINNNGGVGIIENITSTETIAAGATFVDTLKNVDGGTYTLAIVDRSSPDSECAVYTSVSVNENVKSINVDFAAGDAVATDNNNCSSPSNGTIEITSVREDGVAVPISADYSISWSANVPGASIGTKTIAGDSLGGLSAGTYKAVITNSVTYCSSDSIVFTISDDTTDPVISLVDLNDDTFCDPTADTGSGNIEVDVDGNGSDNYYFRWWAGTDTTSVADEITNTGNSLSG